MCPWNMQLKKKVARLGDDGSVVLGPRTMSETHVTDTGPARRHGTKFTEGFRLTKPVDFPVYSIHTVHN